ncbi:hypothetical protein [uncultured Shewanella sp.]|uniref:hypothetical protein n=1 Tax=uncultured Shewanella sp. TaxID=173975 RepID=UPI00260DD548|nr:hypothetical protein [uncultured Shewanella sp.]
MFKYLGILLTCLFSFMVQAADYQIRIYNGTDKRVSRGSFSCIGMDCSFPSSIGAGSSGTIYADVDSNTSSAMIIFEYGSYQYECRGTIRFTISSGDIYAISGTPSYIASAGSAGNLPDCNSDYYSSSSWQVSMY